MKTWTYLFVYVQSKRIDACVYVAHTVCSVVLRQRPSSIGRCTYVCIYMFKDRHDAVSTTWNDVILPMSSRWAQLKHPTHKNYYKRLWTRLNSDDIFQLVWGKLPITLRIWEWFGTPKWNTTATEMIMFSEQATWWLLVRALVFRQCAITFWEHITNQCSWCDSADNLGNCELAYWQGIGMYL